MSRRNVPRIDASDLRDHATEERIARVWDRLEQDLGHLDAASPRRSGLAVALIAATFAAFGGGLLLGRAIWSERSHAPPALASEALPAVVDVLAAGSHERTFQLPGGGEIALAPGTTIEVQQSDGGLTLRLVQGAASVDTARGDRTAALAIVAGEARLSTAAGSVLHVRHNVDDIDVKVTDGSVRLTSPAGSRELGRGDHADNVPIRQRTTSIAPPAPAPVRIAPPAEPPVVEPPAEVPVVAVAAPDWRARYNAGEEAEALAILKQQGGGIDGAITSARTAKELMDLSDVLRGKGGDPGAATRALTRVVDVFPGDPNAPLAAYTLGNMYQRAGDSANAAKYFERARTLAPEGDLAEDSFCNRIRAEGVAGHKDEAIRMAQEYVTKYPDGRCKEEVQRIISGDDTSAGEDPPEPQTPAPDGSAP